MVAAGVRQGIHMINGLKPYERYQLPILGRTFRSIDQYADNQKRYSDYMRNVGREIKYPSIRDFRYTSASIGDAALSGVSQVSHILKGAGKTVRSLI